MCQLFSVNFLLANILNLPPTLFVIHCYTAKFTFYNNRFSYVYIYYFLTIGITIVVSVDFSFAVNFTFYYYFFYFCCCSFLFRVHIYHYICFSLFHIYLRQCFFSVAYQIPLILYIPLLLLVLFLFCH